MATRNDRSLFGRLYQMGEERLGALAEEVLSSPRFSDALGKTVETAMETKGRVDRNMQTLLGLLNLPSKADYRKLATKIEALQGSLVNLNIKLDRILAAQQKPPARPKPQRERAPKARPHPHHEEQS